MKNLLSILILLPVFCYSQHVERSVDEFTGEPIIKTDFVTFESVMSNRKTGSYTTKFAFAKYKEGIYLLVVIKSAWIGTIDKGETFYMKFKDDEVMELSNRLDVITEFSYSLLMNGDENIFKLEFELTPENLEKLASKQLSKCRILCSKGQLTIESNDRLSGEVMDAAREFMRAIE